MMVMKSYVFRNIMPCSLFDGPDSIIFEKFLILRLFWVTHGSIFG
jgi:hypothetical protein